MNKKDFKDFNTEVMLQILAKLNLLTQQLDNEEKLKELNEELIPKFEKLYLAVREYDIRNKSDDEIEKFANIILEVAEKNNLSKEHIKECVRKREELKGKSGAEVTKRMFEFAIKELKKKKGKLQDILKELLKAEEKEEKDLKECIQYIDEMRVTANIIDIREQKREIKANLKETDEEIDTLKKDIENSWKYLIYGTIPKEELENIVGYKKEK